jgi:glycosyltransferase involved in cell wall biosynthesis
MDIANYAAPKRLLIIVTSFSPGGAEKSGIQLARYLGKLKAYEVSLAVLNASQSPRVYNVPEGIKYVSFQNFKPNLFLNSWQKSILYRRISRFVWWIRLRKYSIREQFDLVISFGGETGGKLFIALLGTQINQLTCERNELDRGIHPQTTLETLMRPYIYKHGVACSVQTSSMRDYVKTHWKIDALLTPNFYDDSFIFRNIQFNKDQNTTRILFIGSDTYQKNVELLIGVWQKFSSKMNLSLTVVGSWNSYSRSKVEFQNVTFLDYTNNISDLYDNHDILVSTSLYEGFPNVVAEALISGVTVVSTPSCSVVKYWAEKLPCFVSSDFSVASFHQLLSEVIFSQSSQEPPKRNIEVLKELFSWDSQEKYWISAVQKSMKLTN